MSNGTRNAVFWAIRDARGLTGDEKVFLYTVECRGTYKKTWQDACEEMGLKKDAYYEARNSLVEKNILVASRGFNRTTWYSIDVDVLNSFCHSEQIHSDIANELDDVDALHSDIANEVESHQSLHSDIANESAVHSDIANGHSGIPETKKNKKKNIEEEELTTTASAAVVDTTSFNLEKEAPPALSGPVTPTLPLTPDTGKVRAYKPKEVKEPTQDEIEEFFKTRGKAMATTVEEEGW